MPYERVERIGPHVVNVYTCDFESCQVTDETSYLDRWVNVRYDTRLSQGDTYLRFCSYKHAGQHFLLL